MDVQDYLRELAEVNRNGFGFLLAYGQLDRGDHSRMARQRVGARGSRPADVIVALSGQYANR